MEFFLTGGGDFEHFQAVDRAFLQHLKNGDKVQLLPYASDPEDYDEILERVEDTYGRHLDLSVAMQSNIADLSLPILQEAKAILIEGGNTFDLVTAVRQANLETHFKKIANADKVIYADSAGAIILGQSVKTAFFGDDADSDDMRLQDYRGMSLMGD